MRALVTGASSGIGRAIAERLAERVYDLVITARRQQLLETFANELTNRHGTDVEVLSANLRDRADLERVATRLREPDIDILVANAGFSTRGPFPELRPDLEVAQIELNVISTVMLCQAAAQSMCRHGQGRILITSSAASFQPLPGLATYGATKAFLTSFSQALDAELRSRGVTVTCLAPGFTSTEETRVQSGPAWLWLTSEQVAARAVDGLLVGQPLVVPGWPWRVVAGLAPRLPRALMRWVALRVGRRMAETAANR